MDNGSSRKLLILVAVLALLSGGLSPLAFARQARAATALDWTDSRGPGNGDAPALVWDDTHKILYRATSGKGVWKYQSGTWTSLGGGVSTFGITSLAYDDTGNKLYAGTNAQGVWCYDTSDGTWSNVATVEVNTYYITALAWGEGKLYAGCWDPSIVGKGVWCYDPSGSGTWTDTGGGVASWRVISLAWGDAKLYAGCIDRSGGGETPKGIWCYDPASVLPDKWTGTDDAYVSASSFYSLAWDDVHGLLYGSGTNCSGLFRYDPASTETDKWTDLRKYGVYGTTSLAYDSLGNRVFIGQVNPNDGANKGVWYYDPVADTYTDTGGALSSFNVTSLVCGAYDIYDQYLFAGTSGKGVWRRNLSDSSPTWSDTGGGISSFYTNCLAWDASHNLLYAGTLMQGVWCYDPSTHTWSDTGGTVSSFGILSLAWGGGKLYAGCRDPSFGTYVGVWCYDPFTHTWSDTGGDVSTFEINEFAYDASHNLLYAATVGHGVWRYDPASGLTDKWTDVGHGEMDTYNVTSLVVGGGHLYAACYDTVPGYEGVWSYDLADTDAGWTKTGGGVSGFRIYSLAWSGNKLYANCWDSTGSGVEGVWCYDPSSPDPEWSPVTMPGTITLRIYSMAWGGNKLYASCANWGTTAYEGVRCYDPSGDSWSDTGGDLSNVYVSSLAYDAGQSTLYAGTSFQGVWYADTHAAPTVTSLTPSTGTQGSAVNISNLAGTGFYSTPLVKLEKSGETEITATAVNVVSDTRITCAFDLTGAATGAWDVYVENPDRQKATLQNGFTVNNPTPTITSITPGSMTAGEPAFTLTVKGAGFVSSSVVKWGDPSKSTTYVSATQLTAPITAADIAAAGTEGVTVVNPTPGGGTSNAKTFTVNSAAVSGSTWYLAEGTTAWGFDTYITIENPNPGAVHAAITYMTGSGNISGGTITLPAKSQTTVNPADVLGQKDFSTRVVCTEGKTIAVDRTMSWTGPGAASPEGHSSVGVTAPAKTWYLPEGSSAWGFECWLLIQNPNGSQANCTVTYMIEGEAPVTKTKTVGANSRQSYNMFEDIGAKNASIKVVSSVPVIPERAMYRNNRREGHDSIGTTTAASDYYLAEGTTAWGFTTWVLIQNPGSDASTVTITYMTPSGKKAQPSFSLPGNSRKTIKVNDVAGMANTDFSTQVHGSRPIIAERAMYWDNGTGEACHDSIGMDASHTTFYLPDGQTSEGRETWTLVQNPNTSDVQVEISYLTPTGTGNVVKTETIPANSRRTFGMLEHSGINGRASIMVTSKTSGKKIMVERAMYWNNRGAGTDTIGGYSD